MSTPDPIQLARQKFKVYAKLIKPDYVFGKMHHLLAETLERAIRREPGYTRLAISMPPRHGKSLTISELLPGFAYGLAQQQGRVEHIMEISYAASLAFEFGFAVRNILRSDAYHAIFPEVSMHGDEGRDGAMFRLPGGHSYRAFGVDGSITGKPATLCIVDDPIKNRLQADSRRYIERLHKGFGTDVYTRLEPNAVCIIVHTRWSDQDLIGYVLDKYKADNWRYLRLPALCDSEDDALGRSIGEALVPFRYDEQALHSTRMNMPVRDWMALYQNDPIAASSSFWKPEFFSKKPKLEHSQLDYVFASWDCANELSGNADYTACTVWAIVANEMHCIYAKRDKAEITGLIEWLLSIDAEWRPEFHLIEKAQNGVALKQYLDRHHDIATEYASAQRNKAMEFNLASVAFTEGLIHFDETMPGDMPILLEELSKWPGVANDDLAISALHAIRWFQTVWSTGNGILLTSKHTQVQAKLISKGHKGLKYGKVPRA